MGENGVVECRICQENCGTVCALGMHIKNSCPRRKVMCETCNTLIVFEDLEKHKEQCNIFCLHCDEKLTVITNSTLPVNDSSFQPKKIQYRKVLENGKYVVYTLKNLLIVLDHFCGKKVLSMCSICSKEITMDNILSHKACTKFESDPHNF